MQLFIKIILFQKKLRIHSHESADFCIPGEVDSFLPLACFGVKILHFSPF